MILLDDDPDSKTRPPPRPSQYSPQYQYPGTSNYTSSSSTATSPGSLRPGQWHSHHHHSSSESALSLSSTSFSPSSLPPLTATHSHTYLPGSASQHSNLQSPLFNVTPTPAASLTRIPPATLPRMPFKPMFLLADGNSLEAGFPHIIPPAPVVGQPHPFAMLDVNETDWIQFLTEMRTVANLTKKDRDTAYCIPIVSAIPLINFAIATAIEHHLRGKKPRLVSLLVDKWNHYFFHRRNIEIILMRGQKKLSGQSDQPVAGLYTPRSVGFKAADVIGMDNNNNSISPHNEFGVSQSRVTESDTGQSGKEKKKDRHQNKDKDKTYRLFIVSMDA
ncbi:hypothetical protein R3P38DRAFT_2843576 [Favolaschia claudopus]|uniref:Ras modification protein ERF4 n=1 Tax=Favolaschia claudopus TaxID=2862362 RepID=A0AAW0E2C1_9AGAR